MEDRRTVVLLESLRRATESIRGEKGAGSRRRSVVHFLSFLHLTRHLQQCRRKPYSLARLSAS